MSTRYYGAKVEKNMKLGNESLNEKRYLKKRLSKVRRAAFKKGRYELGCGKSDLRHLTWGWNH